MHSKILPLTDETIEDWRAAPIGDHSPRLHWMRASRNALRGTILRLVPRSSSKTAVQVPVQVGASSEDGKMAMMPIAHTKKKRRVGVTYVSFLSPSSWSASAAFLSGVGCR